MGTGDETVGTQRTWASLVVFFLLSYALTWACWLPLVANRGDFSLPVSSETLATLGQFGPFTAAVMVGLWGGLRDVLRRLFRVWVNPLWYVVALLLPPVLAVGAIHIQSGLTGQTPELVWPDLIDGWVPQLVYIVLLGGPLGEEPGWRGFALPRLQAVCPALLATLFLALVWAGWHLPLWWVADVPCPFPFYVVGVIPLTYLFTWLSNRSGGSVPVALVFHASINTCVVRLPLFPAFEAWTALLWAVAIVVFAIDRRVPTMVRHDIRPRR
jgi:membrane protease YdiL (CAAX protease family)